MNVPLLDLRAQYAQIQAEVEAATLKALRETRYILGPEVAELERELQAYTGARHIIGCASGSDALLLALMALGVQPGDEIITTPFTFFATVSAIVRLGAKPIFVDIDPHTFNLDPAKVLTRISARTRVILPVHLFGQCADMKALLGSNIPIIEDAAQAIGARYQDRQAGTMGVMGTFSFFPSKNLGGTGDGGAISTNDDSLAEKLKVLRVHGSKPKYYHQYLGVNSRLDTLQAAVLRVKLKYLDSWTAARRQNAERYLARFAELGVADRVALPVALADSFHIYNQFTIRIPQRDALRQHLEKNGIGTEIYYPVPMHVQPCFSGLGYRAGDFPEAERAASEALSLPIYPELKPEQIDYVAEKTAEFVNQ